MSEALWNSWNISETPFPAANQPTEQLRFLLQYAILAPSTHNTQPWLFKIRGDALELYADRSRALPVVDPASRALTISCGAALFHLRIALRHFGYKGMVETFPNPIDKDWLARVYVGERWQTTAEEHLLFQAIPKRHTNRQAFDTRQVPESLLTALRNAAAEEGSSFHIVQGEETRNTLGDLIAEGDRRQWTDKRFRRELSAWVHPNRSNRRDGMRGYSFGFGEFMSYAGPLAMRLFDLGKPTAAADRQLAMRSPMLAVLGTEIDTAAAWLSAGQALARVLLRAAAEAVGASFLNQPIEVAELRPRVRDLTGRRGFPQLLLRVGYGPDVRSTPRRPVGDVPI
jgi:nitroreductase